MDVQPRDIPPESKDTFFTRDRQSASSYDKQNIGETGQLSNARNGQTILRIEKRSQFSAVGWICLTQRIASFRMWKQNNHFIFFARYSLPIVPRATIRQLGYSTKNSLKAWHREYDQCNDLRAGYVRSRPQYSAEHKKVTVNHYLSHDLCAAATLRALGYPSRETLADWIEERCPEIRKRIVGRAVGSVPKSHEVKQAAVIELCSREQSARVVAERTGDAV